MKKILIVDDSEIQRKLLAGTLEDQGYKIEIAENGEAALELLEKNTDKYHAVLLDRMMPGIDGIEVLKRMKEQESMKDVSVIMQTAKATQDEILEGLQAGAYYYLTKPFSKNTLLAIVETAVSDYLRYKKIKTEAQRAVGTFQLMADARYFFKTIEEADALAPLLAQACPNPGKVSTGLSELLLNAVEHGNLGITYEEKSDLVENDRWHDEVNRRLKLQENAAKIVDFQMERTDHEVRYLIKDQGEGFDWEKYLEINPERAFDNHGRGIAMSRAMSFDKIEYLGKGNEVLAVVKT